MNPTIVRKLSMFAGVLLLLSANSFAQNGASGKSFVQSASTERLYAVTVYSGKPEMWREAIAFVKDEVVPIRTKGGDKHLECWTSVFGEMYEMWFIAPLENFAALDKPTGYLLKALGSQEAVNAFNDKSRKYSNSVRQFVIRVRPDLSYIKPDAPMPRLAAIAMVEVMYGKELDVFDWVKAEMLPPVKKSDRFGEIRASIGAGAVNGYLVIEPMENFAALDKPSGRTQVLGTNGLRKAMAKMPQGAITRIERRTLIFRPDLSILPK